MGETGQLLGLQGFERVCLQPRCHGNPRDVEMPTGRKLTSGVSSFI